MGLFEQLPYTNFSNLNLGELVKFVNDTIKHIHEMDLTIAEQNQTISDFKDYVTNYLESLDVESDVINYINQLISDGVITDEIKKAVNTIGDWHDRNIIFVGDSYGRGRTYPNTYGLSWCDQIVADLQPNSSYNMSVSQASFSELNTESLRYGKQLETFVSAHSTDVCEGITDIIICGGYNEVYTPTADLVNTSADYCAKWTYNYIKTHFPNARVFIGFIGRVPIFGGAQATFNNFADAIRKYKDIARKYGWKYLINSEYMCHFYEELTSDGIHFKTPGYLEIGRRLANCLNDGAWIPPQAAGAICGFVANADTSDNGIVATNANNIRLFNQYTESGITIFTTSDEALRFMCNSTSITGSSVIRLGKYYDVASEVYSRFVTQYNMRIPCIFLLYRGGTLLRTVHGWLYLEPNGSITLGCLASESSWTETVDLIYISQQQVHLGYSNT